MLMTCFSASSRQAVAERKSWGCCLERRAARRQQGLSQLQCLPRTVLAPRFPTFPQRVPQFLQSTAGMTRLCRAGSVLASGGGHTAVRVGSVESLAPSRSRCFGGLRAASPPRTPLHWPLVCPPWPFAAWRAELNASMTPPCVPRPTQGRRSAFGCALAAPGPWREPPSEQLTRGAASTVKQKGLPIVPCLANSACPCLAVVVEGQLGFWVTTSFSQ